MLSRLVVPGSRRLHAGDGNDPVVLDRVATFCGRLGNVPTESAQAHNITCPRCLRDAAPYLTKEDDPYGSTPDTGRVYAALREGTCSRGTGGTKG